MQYFRGILASAVLLAVLLPLPVSAGDSRPLSGDTDEIAPGTLVIPEQMQRQESARDNADKQCMKVCTRWGEDCMVDVRGVRQCRRSCKEFGEQCF